MENNERPLILFTNDDGIDSPGLWVVVKAFEGLGDLLVVAPREQQSGMARSMPSFSKGKLYEWKLPFEIARCRAFAADGTPAQTVQHGILELSHRKPSLVVSGINYGDNTGNGVTISGTVGAALEAASFGIAAMAVSQQTPFDLHLSYSDDVDFSTAAHFTRKFGEFMIHHDTLPDDVDVLKIDVPWQASVDVEWRMTRVSRRRVYWPTRPERTSLKGTGKLGYHFKADPSNAEPDSDVYALMHDKVVAVTPMSLDMTSRTDMFRLRQILAGKQVYGSTQEAD
ncbi:MAG: 5'/3'-nucleotidase SurE [Anaerolineae bacterium]|nr:5'/3'-nucleotidase SurE [Anaerolineae bacterium]